MYLTFPDAIGKLSGGLPVKIQPESADGEQLTEPQPLSFYSQSDGRSAAVSSRRYQWKPREYQIV